MDRSRRVLGGVQIAADRVDFVGRVGIGPIGLVLGVRERCRLAASFAAGCQLALRLGVGVVDPRAKRRFWD